MQTLFDSVASQVVVSILLGIVVVSLYYSADIYMIFTKIDFTQVNVSIGYFTRNDFNKTADALHMRVIDYRLPLANIYKNRIMLWRVIFVWMRVAQGEPVLNFKEKTRDYLSPVRGIIAKLNAEGEFKRACGLPFVEEKFQIVLVRDRSEETGKNVLKAVVMRDKDLQDYQAYLNNPPAIGKNFHLYKYIGRAYAKMPEAFLSIQMVF